MSAEQMRRDLLEWGKCSSVLHSKQFETPALASLAVQDVMMDNVREMVEKAGSQPILHSYSDDVTSYRTAVVHTSKVGSGDIVRRQGKRLQEFLCQRSWFLTQNRVGEQAAAVLMRPPRSMSEGHTTWHIFGALDRGAPLLKAMDHRGISISHYAFDRAPFSALYPLLHARHELYVERRRAAALHGDDDCDTMQLTDWVCATPCALHDLGNSLKWALAVDCPDKEVLKDLHVCIESVRNTADAMLEKIPPFVVKHACEYAADYHGEEGARVWWSSLGLAPSWADRVAKANPQWINGKLWTALPISSSVSALQELQQCVRHV